MTSTVLITETSVAATIEWLEIRLAWAGVEGNGSVRQIVVDLAAIEFVDVFALRTIESLCIRLNRHDVETVVVAPEESVAGRVAGFYRLDETIVVVAEIAPLGWSQPLCAAAA